MKYAIPAALAASLVAGPLVAQDTMTTEAMTTADMANMDRAELIRTRDITGGNVYTMNPADDEGWSPNTAYDGVGEGWNNIGEIEDVVLDTNGQMIGIVAEVGGFLDIGDKHVLVSTGDVNLVAVDDATYAFVTRLSEEELEQLPDVDEGFWD
ncbi:PRC-barrel domain-containing protein [Wenxinia saemankumensis]|uniref:PRC-barrel domain-containing protein n=1 Tax=Wenxinia saemankumensis TaxID=1447782 RepID=A0A1M6C620_9RHOB|nr:PRC-barrel domain-containing protein [Wenxinia saemankumensis]SHI56475.1 PRC-barrel domain-containing protein [Wenxinia saemankumensis]